MKMAVIKMIIGISIEFFKAEDGIRDVAVTGVQTCALPISRCRLVVRCPADLVLDFADVLLDAGHGVSSVRAEINLLPGRPARVARSDCAPSMGPRDRLPPASQRIWPSRRLWILNGRRLLFTVVTSRMRMSSRRRMSCRS